MDEYSLPDAQVQTDPHILLCGPICAVISCDVQPEASACITVISL